MLNKYDRQIQREGMLPDDEGDTFGRSYKWEIWPNPYDGDYDSFVTNDDQKALDAIMDAAESHLWDDNDGGDGGARILKVKHNPNYDKAKEVRP